MPQNYAQQYSNVVDERFTQAALTRAAFNNDLDFTGVNTVNVYSMATAPMNDYTMTGNQRYGVPDELGTSTQTFTLKQDRAFTFTVDRRNYTDQQMVTAAGRALRRQIDERVIPEVDKYNLGVLVANAGDGETGPITSSGGAYEAFLNGVTAILGAKAPLAGTFAFISPSFYKNIRLDPLFILPSDIGQSTRFSGQVGTVEGVPLILTPNDYLPGKVEFVITNRMAAPAAQKLAEYRTHDNPPGINGWLVEGRLYYDSWVFKNKADAIYTHTSV